jgi:hypothetical protein
MQNDNSKFKIIEVKTRGEIEKALLVRKSVFVDD